MYAKTVIFAYKFRENRRDVCKTALFAYKSCENWRDVCKTALFAYKSCEPDGITEEVCIQDAGLFRIAELIQPGKLT